MPKKLTRSQASAIREAYLRMHGRAIAVKLTLREDGSVEIIHDGTS